MTSTCHYTVYSAPHCSIAYDTSFSVEADSPPSSLVKKKRSGAKSSHYGKLTRRSYKVGNRLFPPGSIIRVWIFDSL